VVVSYGSWIYNYLSNQCLSPLKVVSSVPVHGKVYSIQHYVIKIVSNLRQVGGFLRVLRFPPTNKTQWKLQNISIVHFKKISFKVIYL